MRFRLLMTRSAGSANVDAQPFAAEIIKHVHQAKRTSVNRVWLMILSTH